MSSITVLWPTSVEFEVEFPSPQEVVDSKEVVEQLRTFTQIYNTEKRVNLVTNYLNGKVNVEWSCVGWKLAWM